MSNIFVGYYYGQLRSVDVSEIAAVINHGKNNYAAVLRGEHGIVVCFNDENGGVLSELHRKRGEASHGDE